MLIQKRDGNKRDKFNCLIINLSKVGRGTNVPSSPGPVDVDILSFRQSLALVLRLDTECVGAYDLTLECFNWILIHTCTHRSNLSVPAGGWREDP